MIRLLGILLALALVAPALPVAAADQLQLSVRPGLGGVVRPGTWTPVEVDVANSGPNLSGSVEISVLRQNTRQTAPVGNQGFDYIVPLVVPQHSSKRFSTAVYIPPFFDQLVVRITTAGQTLQEKRVPIQRADPTWTVCGVLSTNQTAYDSLNGLKLGDGQRHPHVVYLDLTDIPTNPQLLSSLDCLIVSDYTTRGFTPSQQAALTSWVDNGGVLAVGTGAAGAGTIEGLPSSLLPARMIGTTPIQSLAGLANYVGAPALQSSGPWLAANLQVTDGFTLASDERQPLLVAARRGKGAVFMLALSPTETPLRGWSGLDRIWTYVLSYVPPSPSLFSSYYPQDTGWGQLPRDALVEAGGVAGPSAQQLLWGLIAFAVLVGPVSLLALTRLGRRELVLFSIPLLAVVASAGAITFANRHRQGDVVVNEASIVRTWDGSGTGEAHTFVGVFGLHPRQVQLALPTDALVSEAFYPFYAYQNAFQSSAFRRNLGMSVVQSGSPVLQGINLEPGLLRTVSLDGMVQDPGHISSTVTLTGNQLSGRLTNGLSSTIYDAAIVASGSVERLGDIRPGASQPVALRVGPGSPVDYYQTDRIVGQLYPNGQHNTRYAILSAALNPRQNYASGVDLGTVSLIGWLNSPVNPVKNPETGEIAQHNTLFITTIPIDLPAKSETIPSQLLMREQLTPSYGSRLDANRLTVNSGESVAFQFMVPVNPTQLNLHSLTLATSTETPITGTLSIFNWRQQAWDTVPFAVGNLSIPSADRFLSPTGAIRVRFQYKAPTAGPTIATFTRFQLFVTGSGR